jgi:hypothetical protein
VPLCLDIEDFDRGKAGGNGPVGARAVQDPQTLAWDWDYWLKIAASRLVWQGRYEVLTISHVLGIDKM